MELGWPHMDQKSIGAVTQRGSEEYRTTKKQDEETFLSREFEQNGCDQPVTERCGKYWGLPMPKRRLLARIENKLK